VAPPTRAALPPENVGAAASQIFHGAPTQAGRILLPPAENGSAARLRGLPPSGPMKR